MAVAQLYFHLAPKAEVGVIAKALVRLLRSHRSVAPGLRWYPTLPPRLVGPLGSPGRNPQKTLPCRDVQLGQTAKKEGFLAWAQPRHRVATSWWHQPGGGSCPIFKVMCWGVWPCPTDGGPLFVPQRGAVRCTAERGHHVHQTAGESWTWCGRSWPC